MLTLLVLKTRNTNNVTKLWTVFLGLALNSVLQINEIVFLATTTPSNTARYTDSGLFMFMRRAVLKSFLRNNRVVKFSHC